MTRAMAPILLPAPTVTGPRMLAPQPMTTSFSIVTFDASGFHVLPPSGGSESHLVVQHYIVADNRGLADYRSRTVIDEKPIADLGARMDLNAAGEQPGSC